MTIEEVQALVNKPIIEKEAPMNNRTHYIRDGSTDVWFVFRDGKLKSVQILWAHKMMRYASYQQALLCVSEDLRSG